ncbi:hypothetical protein [Devosia sp. A449]
MNWLWIVLAVAGLVVAWWVLKIVLAQAVPPEVSGRALLKQELKRGGVDVARLPDRAIDEIVQHCLKAAKGMALASSISPSYGRAEDKNWRANLVRQLQAHVPLIRSIVNGDRPSMADEHIREILVRNGVVGS